MKSHHYMNDHAYVTDTDRISTIHDFKSRKCSEDPPVPKSNGSELPFVIVGKKGQK